MMIKWVWLYPLLLLVYSGYSFVHVDPNLVLSSIPAYWRMQQILWNFGMNMRLESAVSYAVILFGLFLVYFLLIRNIKANTIPMRQLKLITVSSILVLMVSYPALSHDVFNYAFNAKMVLSYQANPHEQVALDFPDDPWLMFMRNTHTPAPYAYGWTVVSLIPGFLGNNHIQTTVLMFRVLMVVFLLLLGWILWRLTEKDMRSWVWIFLLNPLVLIETVSNAHNDVVMMALVLASMYMFFQAKKTGSTLKYVAAGLLFVTSVMIKYASLMLLVGLGLYLVVKMFGKKLSWGGSQSIAHFIPLITARSQRFLSWYLIWPLSFLSLTKEAWMRNCLLLFSVTGLVAYVPIIFEGEYSDQLLLNRTIILFSLPTLYLLYLMFLRLFGAKKLSKFS